MFFKLSLKFPTKTVRRNILEFILEINLNTQLGLREKYWDIIVATYRKKAQDDTQDTCYTAVSF